jgi:hypothetical protein
MDLHGRQEVVFVCLEKGELGAVQLAHLPWPYVGLACAFTFLGSGPCTRHHVIF